jgi:putative SOS response-associated peptidase YedK
VCNRFLATNLQALIDRLRIEGQPTFAFQDTRPTDPASVVVHNPKEDRNEFRDMTWGLFPFWADDPKIRVKLINARAETLDSRSAFSEPFKSRRCLIHASQFYEFDEESRYLVSLSDGRSMAIAGLWEARKWHDEPLLSFAMVTTAPNELIGAVHDRMPAILREGDWEKWLNPTFYDPAELKAMLAPVASEAMRMDYDGPKKAARKPRDS